MVTDDLVLPNQFIAFITTELTGRVVAEGCDGVAAVRATRTEVGVFQIGTLCNYDKQSKYVLYLCHLKYQFLKTAGFLLPYLDTEEQGGSRAHWLGKSVEARLLTEIQLHRENGRKS